MDPLQAYESSGSWHLFKHTHPQGLAAGSRAADCQGYQAQQEGAPEAHQVGWAVSLWSSLHQLNDGKSRCGQAAPARTSESQQWHWHVRRQSMYMRAGGRTCTPARRQQRLRSRNRVLSVRSSTEVP